jgi:hypothetical protein
MWKYYSILVLEYQRLRQDCVIEKQARVSAGLASLDLLVNSEIVSEIQ